MNFLIKSVLSLAVGLLAQSAYASSGIKVFQKDGTSKFLIKPAREGLAIFSSEEDVGDFASACYYGSPETALKIILAMAKSDGIIGRNGNVVQSKDENGFELQSFFSASVIGNNIVAYADYEFADQLPLKFNVEISSCR